MAFEFDIKGIADPLLKAQQGMSRSLQNLGRGFADRLEAKKGREHERGLQAARLSSAETMSANDLEAQVSHWDVTAEETARANKAIEEIRKLEALARKAESDEARTGIESRIELQREELKLLWAQYTSQTVGDADLGNMALETFNRVAWTLGGTPDPNNPGRYTVTWPEGEVEYAEFRKTFMQEAQKDLEFQMEGLPADVKNQQLEAQLDRVRTMLGDRDAPGSGGADSALDEQFWSMDEFTGQFDLPVDAIKWALGGFKKPEAEEEAAPQYDRQYAVQPEGIDMKPLGDPFSQPEVEPTQAEKEDALKQIVVSLIGSLKDRPGAEDDVALLEMYKGGRLWTDALLSEEHLLTARSRITSIRDKYSL
jgi:hypothetical protein